MLEPLPGDHVGWQQRHDRSTHAATATVYVGTTRAAIAGLSGRRGIRPRRSHIIAIATTATETMARSIQTLDGSPANPHLAIPPEPSAQPENAFAERRVRRSRSPRSGKCSALLGPNSVTCAGSSVVITRRVIGRSEPTLDVRSKSTYPANRFERVEPVAPGVVRISRHPRSGRRSTGPCRDSRWPGHR